MTPIGNEEGTKRDEGPSPYRAGIERTGPVLVTTGNDIAGHRVVGYLGVVRGIVVRSINLGQGIVGSLKQIMGGNIKEYTTVCEAARHEAYQQMVAHAELLEAHAIIAMRYDATEFLQGATEVLAYGTAVRIERV
jgi:uncharacterized protein YbjQ (UPF0145 family)